MTNSPGRPSPRGIVAGGGISADQIGRIVDELARRIVGDGVAIKVRTFGRNQIVIEGIPARIRTPRTGLGLFRVITEYDDYLLCDGYDAVSGTSLGEVPVLKPYELQKEPFHGNAITYPNGYVITYEYGTFEGDEGRVAKGDVSWKGGTEYVEELQQITPPYYIGAVLVGARVPASAIEEMINTIPGSDPPVPISWMDNTSGRAWAFVRYETAPP